MAVATALLTIEEYIALPDTRYPTELVRGRIVELPPPKSRHGQICVRIIYLLMQYLDGKNLGHLLSNDSGIITERNPDSMRGANIAYYSYAKVPKGPLPEGYLQVPPELIFEVRSPGDRWRNVLTKAAEYLEAGVELVVVIDPADESAHLFHSDRAVERLSADDTFRAPTILGDFEVQVARFFEAS